MKKKQIITILSILFALSTLFAAFTGCNNGKHNFSEEWKSNETHHWHACADKGCNETKDKAEHSWDGGNVTVEPTTEQKNEKETNHHNPFYPFRAVDVVCGVYRL